MLKKTLVIGMVLSLFMESLLPFNINQSQAEPPLSLTGQEVSIKVMSFNIQHGANPAGVLNLRKTAETIKLADADIIGLQEVDNHWSKRSNFQDQAKWLAEYLGMEYAYGANLDMTLPWSGQPRRQYGTAVLSKYPILFAKNHLLTSIPYPIRPTEQRGLLETLINVNGYPVRFFNTHLDFQRAQQRDLQVQEVMEYVKQSEEPAIIVGDFNARPNSGEIQRMTSQYSDAFTILGKNEAYTYPTPYVNSNTGREYSPSARIDYVFTSKEVKIEQAEVMDSKESDHLPILATLVLGKKNSFQ